MYTTNFPDDVLIPDMLVTHAEAGVLSDQARDDAATWVRAASCEAPDARAFWRRQMQTNVTACRTYGLPDHARIFAHVCELIDQHW